MQPAQQLPAPAAPDLPSSNAPWPRARRRQRPMVAVLALSAALAVTLVWGPDAVGSRLGGQLGSTAPPPPASLSPTPLGRPAPAPYGTGGYAFLAVAADGRTPVAWDPCREVRVVVRPAGEPAGGGDLLQWAFDRLSVATGLRFVFEGPTDETPSALRPAYQPQRYGQRWAPVLVAWSTVAEAPELAPDRLGVAGPTTYGGRDGNDRRHVSGTAVFNGPAVDGLLRRGRDQWARAVLLHELGHLAGLDHVQDQYQVMHGVNAAPLDSYRDGDLRGLELLGGGRCFTDH